MNYIVQQSDIDILRQSERQIFIKIELLNHDFKIIDSLEGSLISDSFSIDASSDIRRTYSCELFVKNSSFFIGNDKKIWIDKYIRPYIGILHQRSNTIIWYLEGTFIFNDTNYNYDASTRSLSLTCSDLMCTLNGDRGGYDEGLTITIKEGSYIRDVLVSLLNDAKIINYRVEDIGKTIPYDLEHSAGTTYYDILKEIVELYAGYEMFFDIDGTFIIQSIPTTKDEISVLDENIFTPLVISEQISNSFNKIYNVTQVWGSTIETDYYTQNSSTIDGKSYTATIKDLTSLDNFNKYGIKILTTCGQSPTLCINALGYKNIVEDDGKELSSGRLLANTDYVFKYRKASDDFLLLGNYQAYGEYVCQETDNPFSVKNLDYEMKQVLKYDELYSDSLCKQRAKYETWLATRMKDTITLSIMSIPFLDVNKKISYKKYQTGDINNYIIKQISGSNKDSTMNITLIKYSELYPDII